ncbi:MAG: hypothetical protein ACC645_03680 [Pirellulales bacterium]
MAKIRRIIRKTKPAAELSLEEQMWPVILALFVLGGFMVGTVLAYLSFDDPCWYTNAATWVFAIPIAGCIAIWLLRHINARAVRRSLQLSAVVCLILHLLLFVVSIETDIFGRFWDELAANPRTAEPREVILEPQYDPIQLQPEEQQDRELFRPVTSETPDPEVQEVPQQPLDQEEATTERQPVPVPETEPAIVPHAILRKPPAETSPRQNDHASKLSRQIAEAKPRPDERVATPQIAASPTAQPSRLETQQPMPRRAAAPLAMERPAVNPDATVNAPQPDVRLSRRSESSTPRPEASPAPTLQRRLAQPARVPRSDVASAESPAAARQTRPDPLTPNNTTARRQRTASPSRERIAAQPVPETTRNVSERAERRDQRNLRQPALAQTPTPVPNPRTRLTLRPDIATMAASTGDHATPQRAPAARISPNRLATGRRNTAHTAAARTSVEPGMVTSPADRVPSALPRRARASDAPSIAATSSRQAATARRPPTRSPTPSSAAVTAAGSRSEGPPAQALGPSATTVARRGGGGPTGARGGPQPATPATTAAARPGGIASRRTAVASVPTMTPDAPSGTTPTSATRSAALTRSPTRVDRPVLAAAEQGVGQRIASPARMALSKSLSGVAGFGQSANLDRALPADASPAMIASGAARRREATQQAPAGPALAPSALARVHRSTAGEMMPVANIEATSAEHASLAGVREPSAWNASSSASLARQMATVAEGTVTAASGRVEVDVGPTRVVDEQGHARASGGGQPELNFETDAPQLARRRPGGGAPMNLDAAAAPAVEAPAGTGGGQPMTEFDPAATHLSRADQGQAQPTAGGPDPDATGPAAGVPTTDLVEGATVVRGDREAVAGQGDSGPQIGEALAAMPLKRRTAGGAPSISLAAMAVDAQAPADSPMQPQVEMGGVGAQHLPRAMQAGADAIGSLAAELVPPDSQQGGGEFVSETTIVRAEAVDAAQGVPEPGGGTASPQRTLRAQPFASNRTAENTSVAGGPNSSGIANGLPAGNSGLKPRRSPGGALGSPAMTTHGARAGDVALDGSGDGPPDLTTGSMERASLGGEGPAVGEAQDTAAPLRRAATTQLNVATTADPAAMEAGMPGSLTVAKANFSDLTGGLDVGPLSRQASAAIPVDMNAAEGPGGFGSEATADVGLNSRRSQPDSMQVSSRAERFIRREFGGQPALDTTAVIATEPFRRRSERTAGRPGENQMDGQVSPQTEEAIERGLAFLARSQLPDGSWSLQSFDEEAALVSDTAATALSLLAFQGAGYNHREHQYASNVSSGLDYLVKDQKADGDLFVGLDDASNRSVWLYSHSIAALALCEAYGMTQDPELKGPAQLAVDFIVAAQDKDYGGWRYTPGVGSDTSVTGWMMMALRSGDLAGLKVPSRTYALSRRWLDSSQASRSEKHLYRYNPFAPDTPSQRHGRTASKTMTAVGLLVRLYDGWRRDHEAMIRGADYLRQHLPTMGTRRGRERDTYYWYYGTQVMFHMGGKYWEDWNDRLHPMLVATQDKDGPLAGSWHPALPVPDRWGPHAGRLYVTTMNLLSLEVYYRHLPLYDDTAR